MTVKNKDSRTLTMQIYIHTLLKDNNCNSSNKGIHEFQILHKRS